MAARVLALVLAMVMTARADNCKSVHSGMVFNSAITNCNGGGLTETDCPNCCKPDDTVCYGYMMKGESCADGKIPDVSKQGTALANAAAYTSTCCKTPSPVTVDNTCTNTTIMMKATDNMASMCDGKMIPDPTKVTNSVKADGSDWKARCCSMPLNCPACGAGMKAKADATTCSTIPCDLMDCCDYDSTVCMGVFVDAAMTGTQLSCDTDKFMDTSKVAAAATKDTFKTDCCTANAKCADFKTASLGGGGDTASTSTRQHAATLSLLLAVVAVMGK